MLKLDAYTGRQLSQVKAILFQVDRRLSVGELLDQLEKQLREHVEKMETRGETARKPSALQLCPACGRRRVYTCPVTANLTCSCGWSRLADRGGAV